MTWISVNPKFEDSLAIDAALAISSTPENQLDMYFAKRSDIDPVFLAECYNKAESLGLDLFPIKMTRGVRNHPLYCHGDDE